MKKRIWQDTIHSNFSAHFLTTNPTFFQATRLTMKTPTDEEARPMPSAEDNPRSDYKQPARTKSYFMRNVGPKKEWYDEPFPKRGYGHVAHEMALPDSRLAIFRKFGDISMLTLLGLQADILDLRRRFWILCEGDERNLEESIKNPKKYDPDATEIPILESFSSMREGHKEHLRDTRHGLREQYSSTGCGSNDDIEQVANSELVDDSPDECPYCLLEQMRNKLKEYRSSPDFSPHLLPPV